MKTSLLCRRKLNAALTCALLGVAIAGEARAALAAYRGAVLGDGAVAYYEFEETSGTVAADSAGADNNGAYLGGVALNQTSGLAGLGRSAGFDGTDDRVRIPDSPVFDLGTGAFSVELWFRAATSARGDLITYKGGAGDFGIHSSSQSLNTSSLYHTNYKIQSAPVIAQGWNYIVATRTAGGLLSFYVNGILAQTATDTESMNIPADLLIGSNHMGDPANLTLMFQGNIDEVAIYPSALSQAQITSHFNLAGVVPEPSTAGVLLLSGVAMMRRRRAR